MILPRLFLVAALCSLVACTQLPASPASPRTVRLLASVEHDMLRDEVRVHHRAAVGPVNVEVMKTFIMDDQGFTPQRLYGSEEALSDPNSKEFVLLMGDISVASYDENHGKTPLPRPIHDGGREADQQTTYYCYLFEDSEDAERLYIGFPGSMTARDLWEDIKIWLSSVHDVKETCPKVFSITAEDAWSMWDIFQGVDKDKGLDYFSGVVRMVTEAMARFPAKKDIFFTGHSLGGSMAALASARFGMPAVGFSAPGTFRYQKRNDLPTSFNSLLRVFADGDDLVSMLDYQAGYYCPMLIEKECGWDIKCYLEMPFQRHVLQNVLTELRTRAALPSCHCQPTLTQQFARDHAPN